jgi:hypothetical protein
METTRAGSRCCSTTRKRDGVTRQRPEGVTTVAVCRFSREIVPRIVRPSSVLNSTVIPTENRASCMSCFAERMRFSRSTIRQLRSMSSASERFVRSIVTMWEDTTAAFPFERETIEGATVWEGRVRV